MGSITRWLGHSLLRLGGWRLDSTAPTAPTAPKYILLTAPHTSNWDFVVMMAAGMALGIWPHWVGKHTLFKPPFGTLARKLRGIPVDRRSASNMVEQLAQAFTTRDQLILAMPPEGTRGYAEYWKSGFYHVALAAGVPVALSCADFATKTATIGPLLMLTGDVQADMNTIRAFYAGKKGLHPERQGPIRLKAEDL